MKKYNSYADAKIDNPESEIFSDLSNPPSFYPQYHTKGLRCHPADHCMTLEQFFDSGHKIVDGDAYLNSLGVACVVGINTAASKVNARNANDNKRYILRAKALELKLKPEWANGDECVINRKSKARWMVVGVNPLKGSVVCVSDSGELKDFHEWQLKKPESPAEKARREALELLNPGNYGMASPMVEAIVDKLSSAGMLKSKDEE